MIVFSCAIAGSDRISLESKAMRIARQHGKNLEIINFIDEMVKVANKTNPYIGYEKSAEIVKTALKEGKTIKQIAEEENILEKEKLEKIFDPFNLTTPRKLKRRK